MNMRRFLFTVLICASPLSFASADVYTSVGKLEGNAVMGQETTFKIPYKWMAMQKRSGKIFYNIVGTDCNGVIDIGEHSAMLPVAGTADVTCTIKKSKVFKSDTVLQLYDGKTKKELSSHQTGDITVTTN